MWTATPRIALAVALVVGAGAANGCASSTADVGTGGLPPGEAGVADDAATNSGADDASVGHFGDGGGGEGGEKADAASVGAGVYAIAPGNMSTNFLYRFDPSKKALTTIGPISGDCLTGAWGLAIDSAANAYTQRTDLARLCKIDLNTAVTTLVGTYTNTPAAYLSALSFVPKGTLDPSHDTLVGYLWDQVNHRTQYVRIDTVTAALTVLGTLPNDDNGNAIPAMGMTSVNNGGTFITVTTLAVIQGQLCGDPDCLLQVDPKTGGIIQNYGEVLGEPGHSIRGLAYWAGVVYGFGDQTNSETTVYSVSWNNSKPVATAFQLPKYPTYWGFVGSASSLAAPSTDGDGGGPPLQ